MTVRISAMSAKTSYFTASVRKSAKNLCSVLIFVKRRVESVLHVMSLVRSSALIATALRGAGKSARTALSLVAINAGILNAQGSASKSAIESHVTSLALRS